MSSLYPTTGSKKLPIDLTGNNPLEESPLVLHPAHMASYIMATNSLSGNLSLANHREVQPQNQTSLNGLVLPDNFLSSLISSTVGFQDNASSFPNQLANTAPSRKRKTSSSTSSSSSPVSSPQKRQRSSSSSSSDNSAFPFLVLSLEAFSYFCTDFQQIQDIKKLEDLILSWKKIVKDYKRTGLNSFGKKRLETIVQEFSEALKEISERKKAIPSNSLHHCWKIDEDYLKKAFESCQRDLSLASIAESSSSSSTETQASSSSSSQAPEPIRRKPDFEKLSKAAIRRHMSDYFSSKNDSCIMSRRELEEETERLRKLISRIEIQMSCISSNDGEFTSFLDNFKKRYESFKSALFENPLAENFTVKRPKN